MTPVGASSAATVRRAASSIEMRGGSRQLGLVPRARPVEPAVAEDHATRAQRRLLEVRNRSGRVSRQLPRDALHEKTARSGRPCCRQEIDRSLATHADVRRPGLCEMPLGVRKIGELVHDHVRPERDDCVTERFPVVHVADDCLCTERSEGVGLVRRARHCGDLVSGGHQQRNHTHPDHATRACHEDPHRRDATSGRPRVAVNYSIQVLRDPFGIARGPEGAGEGIRTLDPALTRRVL